MVFRPRKMKDRVQTLVDEVLHLLQPESDNEFDACRPVFVQVTRLEERVLMSASPTAMVADAVTSAVSGDITATESTDTGACEEIAPVTGDSESSEADQNEEENENDAAAGNVYVSNEVTTEDGASCVQPGLPESLDDVSCKTDPGPELVVIDSRVSDADDLLSRLLSDHRDIRLLRLDGDVDGIQQISAKLEQIGNVSSIHLLTHGRDGEILLGSTRLNSATLSAYTPDLLAWQHSLTRDADILLYGCDVAKTVEGQQFAESLHRLTGADLAASTNITGSSLAGGDWVFEYNIGTIETPGVFSAIVDSAWNNKLGLGQTIIVTTTSDVVDGDVSSVDALLANSGADGWISLREALMAANTGSDIDEIVLGSGTYFISIPGKGDVSHKGEFVVLADVIIRGAGSSLTVINGNSVDRVFDVRNLAHLTITDLAVTGGFTNDDGGGIQVGKDAALTLDRVVMAGNSASRKGGAIYSEGTVNLNEVSLTSNTAHNDGGAFYNKGTAVLTNVTIADNTGIRGGGIFHDGNDSGLALANVTLSGNSAANSGGGLYAADDATLQNVTIAFNTAGSAGAGIFVAAGNVTLRNTLLASNVLTTNAVANVIGSIISLGYNLDSDGTSGLSGPGDLSGVDAKLKPLADNGGSTQTHGLGAGSAAINAGSSSGAPTRDQRGLLRDGPVDIGAFEFDRAYLPVSQFEVNTAISGTQVTAAETRGSQQAVARNDAGNYIVTWSSFAQDGSGWGVYAQRFNFLGQPQGAEFRVNATASNDQQWAGIAADAAGNFVITWTSTNQDSAGYSVYARRYSAAGVALGSEFLVNTAATGDQKNSVISMSSTGSFVIAWQGVDSSGNPGILFRRFSADGTALDTADRAVTTSNSSTLTNPAIAMDNTGRFVIVWQKDNFIYFQRYSTNGSSQGAAVQVDNALANSSGPAVAMDGAGNFTVVYREHTTLPGIWGRGYNADGTNRYFWFQADSGAADSPSIAMAYDGQFVLTYQNSSDGDGTGIYSRKFNANGTANGAAFLVNQYTAGDQAQPSIALLDTNNFVVVWSGQSGSDSSGVMARQYGTGTTKVLKAQGDLTSTPTNTSVVIDILNNDIRPDNDVAILLDVAAPGHGTAVVNSDGSVTYTPETGYAGPDSFNYRITDGTDGTTHFWGLGGTAIDSVGGLNGTIYGASTVAGEFGTALQFDEVNDCVEIPDVSYNSEFTVSFEFKIDDNTGTEYQYLYSHGDSASTNSLNIFLGEDSKAGYAGILKTVFGDIDDAYDINALNTNIAALVNDGQWHTYTLTVNKTVGSQVYIDGALRTSSAGRGGDAFDPAGNLILGARNDFDSVRYLGGGLDSVRIFDRALESSDVTLLHNGESPSATAVQSTAVVSVTVQNEEPTAVINGPYITNPGSGVNLSAVGSSDQNADSLTFEWDLNYDGVDFNTSATGITTAVSWSQLQSSGNTIGVRTIAVRVTDSRGAETIETTTLSVLNTAPVLASGTTSLGSIAANQISPAVRVSDLLNSDVSDPDLGALSGIAITTSTGAGQWQYSLDGSTWLDLDAVSTSQARLLRSTDWIRFAGSGLTAGSATLSFSAWDQSEPTSGLAGTRYALAALGTGGSTPFSSGLRTATFSLQAVNFPPLSNPDSYQLNEDMTLTTTSAEGWYNLNWSTRQKLTFNNAAGATHVNQVVLVTLNSDNIDYSRTQNAGQDLRFIDTDGTLLNYEIEEWNEGGTSRVWVRVPQIDAASTSDGIWLYYGNASAIDSQNKSAVWSGYDGVLHMNGTVTDSSPNGIGITDAGTDPANGISSGARFFDGLSDSVKFASSTQLDNLFSGGGTISAWINPTGWGENGYGRIADKASATFAGGTLGSGWAFQLTSTGSLLFQHGFSSATGTWQTAAGSVSLNVWQHVQVVYDSSSTSNVPKIFVNGAQVGVSSSGTPSGTSTSDSGQKLTVGNYALSTTRTFDGRIDEFRVYGSSTTTSQMQSLYLSMADSFVSVGTAQAVPTGVLANDSDPEGSALTVSLVAGPQHSQSFLLNSDGTFTYVPTANFNGMDSFTYSLTDSTNTVSPVLVTLNVVPVNDAPTTVTLSATSLRGYTTGAVVGNVGVLDVDAGDSHTMSVSDSRFEIVSGALRLKSASSVNPVTEPSISLSLTATDSSGAAVSRNFTITVSNPNTAPSLSVVANVTSLPESVDTSLPVRLAEIVITDDGIGTNQLSLSGADTSLFTLVGNTLYLKSGVTLRYALASSHAVAINVNDPELGVGIEDSKLYTLNVEDINEAPIAVINGPYVIAEGDSLTASALGSSDPDGDSLSYAWDLDGDNIFTDATGLSPTVTWAYLAAQSSAVNDSGVSTIRLQVTDSRGLSTVATTSLTVLNTPPVITASGPASVNSGAVHTLSLSATDPGQDSISMWTINWGDGITETASGTSSTATHVYSVPGGTRLISVTGTDEDGTYAAAAPVQVTVRNRAPSNLAMEINRLPEAVAGATAGRFSFRDADVGDWHVITVSDSRFEVVGNELRLKAGQAVDGSLEPVITLEIRVTDRSNASAAGIWSIPVDRAPVGVADAWLVDGTRQLSVSSPSLGVLANDGDADNDTLQAVLIRGPGHASAFGMNTDGTFWYRPTAGYSGTDTFVYAASDGLIQSAPVTVTLTVNQPASLSFVSQQNAVNENTILLSPRLIGQFVVADNGIGTNTLELAGADREFFLLNPDGRLYLQSGVTLNFEARQNLTATVLLRDPETNGGADISQSVLVSILDVNEVPVTTGLGDVIVLEDLGTQTISTASAFSDEDSDPLQYSVRVVSQTVGLLETVSINRNTGIITWRSTANVFGSASLTVTGTDSNGASARASFTILVQPVNDAPVVQAFSTTTFSGQTLIVAPGRLLAGATDVEGDPIRAILVQGPRHGTIVLNIDGSFVYRPDAGYFGRDSFQFAGSDGVAAAVPAAATIIVQAPFAAASTGSGSLASSSTATASSVTADTSAGTGTTSGNSGTSSVPSAPDTTTGTGAHGSSDNVTGSGSSSGKQVQAEVQKPTNETGDIDATAIFLQGFEVRKGKILTAAPGAEASGSSAERESLRRTTRELQMRTRDLLNGTWDTRSARTPEELQRQALYRELAASTELQIDSFEKKLTRNMSIEHRVVGSVGVVTTGFSVGYLIWVIRGGMLLSGVLSQIPAWTMLDPLMVIDGDGKEDDKESIQTIVDGQQNQLNTRKEVHEEHST